MTTNNLIGYDPLAWMEEENVEETPVAEPVKTTKSKSKAKATQVEPKTVVEEIATPVAQVEDDIVMQEDDDIAIDVSIDEHGEIEIKVDANENAEISVDVSFKSESEEDDNEILDALVEEVNEISETEHTPEMLEESEPEVEDAMPEEIIAPLIELGSDVSLKTLASLYEQCKKVLSAHDVIEIDASDVATIDTATFQLLVSLKKDAPNLSKTINIISPSARFVESAKLLDLVSILEIDD